MNHVGKDVEVLTADGKKVQGVLTAVEEPRFTVRWQEKVKVEGKKHPVMQDVEQAFDMNKVKYCKYLFNV